MSKMDQLFWLQRAVAPPGHQQHYKLSGVLIFQTWVSHLWWAVDKLLSDCSGAIFGGWRWVDTRFLKNGVWVDYKTLCGTARPTAHKLHAVCATYGIVFRDPWQVKSGDLAFRWNRWTRRWTHVWFNQGHNAPPPWGDSTSFTFEYGDGTGHAAIHTDLWQRTKYGAPYVEYGRLVTDLGDLTPIGETPTLPPITLPIARGCTDGLTVRLLKGIMNWVIPGCHLGTAYTTDGQSFGPITEGWVKKFQTAAGLKATGVVDAATMTEMQKELRKKVA